MKISFFSRFLAFTLSFWCGTVVSVFLLTAINVACFFQNHFWRLFLTWIHFDVIPVALTEIFRSPVMGLLFAFLGSRNLSLLATIRFGAVCGAASYAVADASNLASFTWLRWVFHFRQPVVQYIILGLPIALILLSRFPSRSQTLLASKETPSS